MWLEAELWVEGIELYGELGSRANDAVSAAFLWEQYIESHD